jgi:hypothetical protein
MIAQRNILMMKKTDLGQWAVQHPVWAYLLLPALISSVMMALYFSGSEPLQQIVAPTVEELPFISWREFGALELLQNALLLAIVVCLFRLAYLSGVSFNGFLFLFLAAGFIFVLLEEIDYGIHFIQYFGGAETSPEPGEWNRNLHNRTNAEGVQYGSYMKSLATLSLALGFLIAPFVLHDSKRPLLRLFTPSRWAAGTVLLIVLLSRTAHALDSAGLSHINGVPGSLEYNISEFRELNMYYLFWLYFVELHRRITAGWPDP